MIKIRQRAQEERKRLGVTSRELLARLTEEIENVHELEIQPSSPEFLQGSRGWISLKEQVLNYDRRLRAHPEQLLEVLAHEYGHLLLHQGNSSGVGHDLLRGSCLLQGGGVSGLARYTKRSKEETEATAFAAELICPAREVFKVWSQERKITLNQLAARYFATPALVRQQLAEGFFLELAGEEPIRGNGAEPCTQEQEAAATLLGLPVLLGAGPGSGKSKTLVRRVEYLVCEKGIHPSNILVLTFSHEAASELRDRIVARIDQDTEVYTFHGFGRYLLDMLGQEVWPARDFADHPHHKIYRSRALRCLERFAENFPTGLQVERWLDDELEVNGFSLKLSGVGHFLDQAGRHVLITLQLGDFPNDEVSWGELKQDHYKLPYVLLEDAHPNSVPLALDANRGKTIPFRWRYRSQPQKEIPVLAQRAKDNLAALIEGRFQVLPKDWNCDRCRVRMVCPVRIGALENGRKEGAPLEQTPEIK